MCRPWRCSRPGRPLTSFRVQTLPGLATSTAVAATGPMSSTHPSWGRVLLTPTIARICRGRRSPSSRSMRPAAASDAIPFAKTASSISTPHFRKPGVYIPRKPSCCAPNRSTSSTRHNSPNRPCPHLSQLRPNHQHPQRRQNVPVLTPLQFLASRSSFALRPHAAASRKIAGYRTQVDRIRTKQHECAKRCLAQEERRRKPARPEFDWRLQPADVQEPWPTEPGAGAALLKTVVRSRPSERRRVSTWKLKPDQHEKQRTPTTERQCLIIKEMPGWRNR